MGGAGSGAGGDEAVDQASEPLALRVEVALVWNQQIFCRGELRRMGASSPSTFGLMMRPRMLARTMRGGTRSPTAHSMLAAQ